MAAIIVNGVATSYDLPQHLGQLFQKRERPNAILRLIGGLAGNVRLVNAPEFPMGVDYELPDAAQPALLEAAAPAASEIATAQAGNIVQIFQEAVELSYSRQAASGSLDGIAKIPGGPAEAHNHPGTFGWQLDRKLEVIQRNLNYSMLRGAYQKPVDNTTARKMRGVRTSVTTNLFANGAVNRAISKAIFTNALRDMVLNGAFPQGSEIFCVADAVQFAALTALYEGDTQLPVSREVVGVSVKTIVTNWAVVHLVWEPDMATGELFIFRPDVCRPVAMPVPGKGILFSEPLAKVGSSDKFQVYGEFSVDYRNEVFHGVIDDLS